MRPVHDRPYLDYVRFELIAFLSRMYHDAIPNSEILDRRPSAALFELRCRDDIHGYGCLLSFTLLRGDFHGNRLVRDFRDGSYDVLLIAMGKRHSCKPNCS